MTALQPDEQVVQVAALTLADYGAFPVKVCTVGPHSHGDEPCHSPGKVPLDAKWQRADLATTMDQYLYWLKAGFNVGLCPDGLLIGIDEDVVGGLDKFFERCGEDVPITFGDVVPTTGKRHIWVLKPDEREVLSEFGDGQGQKFGEVARARKRHFVAPGCVWTNGTVTELRVWNGVHEVATLSEAAMALLAVESAPREPKPESGSEWQWTQSMGSRHNLIVKEARRLAGSIRDEELLVAAMLDWSHRHGLIGKHPESGRFTHEREVRDAVSSALRKFDEDPEPITLNIPRAEEYERQQEERQSKHEQAQTAAFETLFSLPYGPPNPPLVHDMFIAAEGWTVLYANGGSGKGLLALWMVQEYLRREPDALVMVLDYEAHHYEWSGRSRAMGWSDDELRRVVYINPYHSVWKKGHTLEGIAPELAPLAHKYDVGLFVVDSYTMASKAGSEQGGAEAAIGFFKAAAVLDRPGLVLAHTAATNERLPAKPFGSSHIHNLARETWAGAKGEVIEMGPTKGMFGVTSTLMQVEVANRKRSVGAQPMGRQGFDIEFTSLGGIDVRWTGAQTASVSRMVLDVLVSGRMTVKAMGAAIEEDTGEAVSRNTLEKTVRSMVERGELVVVGDGRPKSYALPARAADED